jgi:NTP pyrophosphatase (non-canonical NTP hydrolase)
MLNPYKRAIEHWGKEAQIMKTLEELDELKDKIYKDLIECEINKIHLIEEIADVWNMLHQLEIIYNIDRKEIIQVMESKMQRTMQRIEYEKLEYIEE